jgi:hypothetical protein
VAIPENGHSVSFGEEDFSVRDPKKSQACFQSVRVDDVAGRRRDQQAAFITASVGLQIEPGELLHQEVYEQPPANRPELVWGFLCQADFIMCVPDFVGAQSRP